MSEVTAEQARAASEVLRALQHPPNVWTQGDSESMGRSARILDDIAKRMEREQAEKAKRDKRIEELAGKMRLAAIEGAAGEHWESAARWLIKAHPSLLDEDGER